MVHAMCRELDLRAAELEDKTLHTVYFGGGTPSILNREELEALFEAIRRNFTIAEDAEITLEANPDDVTNENLSWWKSIGINRFSMGVQSFREEDLQNLNRAHHAEQAIACITEAQQFGFDNLTIDLIYGIPGLSDEDWEQNLQTAIDLNIPHISAYCLTVEPQTALAYMVKRKEVPPVDEEAASRHFLRMIELLSSNGYVQYEISNFGKEGRFSRHNSAYWKGKPYLGIGPSAHSYSGNTRSYNISNNKRYIDAIKAGTLPLESEELDISTQYNEYIMTGLRTIWGVDADQIHTRFGASYQEHFFKHMQPWLEQGFVAQQKAQYTLNPEGLLMADRISSELFFV
jgi:oxygen-independent coproporphyrinogen-3 oxidase